MDIEHELFNLAQRVAALESTIEAKCQSNCTDINKLGNAVRAEIKAKVDDGVMPKVEKLDKSIFKAQIYIAVTLAVVSGIALVVQYIISVFGITLSDISFKGK